MGGYEHRLSGKIFGRVEVEILIRLQVMVQSFTQSSVLCWKVLTSLGAWERCIPPGPGRLIAKGDVIYLYLVTFYTIDECSQLYSWDGN
ncbi:hypothetical protein FRX31_030808 [Thalictrum thalictroides]|uniref:Uncharacterized protein n=1 Tax=Thalictrum thalictroides TaxID=46969 RepID=A0A7J6V5C5_THATH|nr:hypothetical protein FRX31_030808 [Thalictrum thalictroides]